MFTLSASMAIHGRIQRGGGQGSRPPLKNHKNIGDFSNMCQSYQASIQCRVIIGTLANRHLNGVSLAGRLWPANIVVFGSSHKKNVAKLDPSSKTLWILAWAIYNVLVICNHCFTPAPEQGRDIHSLVNVLCFYFYIVSTMWRKCCGLIDIDKHGSAV